MTKTKHNSKSKQHGNHHRKDSKKYQKPYWPYIAISLLLIGTSFVLSYKPSKTAIVSSGNSAVLAYATGVSSGGLLSHSNAQRQANGAGNLAINSQLTQAAQSKANDMVARDYWSHNTPDGQTPWTFISAAGYSYRKAGENLAYGFSTSAETVTGWMNSPPHREALLDAAYSDVGFGFANSANFIANGEQTIVVAMYGAPVTAPTPVPPPVPTPTPQTPAPTSATAPQTAATGNSPTPEQTTPVETATPEPDKETETPAEQNQTEERPYNSESPPQEEGKSVKITLLQRLTRGNVPWAAGALTIATALIGILWIARHSHNLMKKIKQGEKFIQHHPLIDAAVISFIALTYVLTRIIGIVR